MRRRRRGRGGHQQPLSPPQMMRSALHSAVRQFLPPSAAKCPKAPIRFRSPNQAKPSPGVRLRPPNAPPASTTNTTPPSPPPRRLRPPSCGNGAVTSLSVLKLNRACEIAAHTRRQLRPSGYGGEAQGGWSLDCTQIDRPTCPDYFFLPHFLNSIITIRTRDFLFFLSSDHLKLSFARRGCRGRRRAFARDAGD